MSKLNFLDGRDGYSIHNERIYRNDIELRGPELDAVMFHQYRWIDVLDDGFVRCVSSMGDDSSIVQAARVSYGKGTKTVLDDKKLIHYLYKHKHTSPFEMVEFKFHVRVPMDCWRQWIRHRTASVNEYSTRYSIAIDSMASACGQWRQQSSTNRQGSGDLITDEAVIRELNDDEKTLQELSRAVYERRIALGVAREQARKDLPLSTYTEAYWKIDLHNLLHFLRLRLAPNAQHEIRQYAKAIDKIVTEIVPTTMEAFHGES